MPRLPFGAEQFFAVFGDYNLATWPVQLLLYPVAVAAVYFALSRRHARGRAVSLLLALLWAWSAVAYHLAFFTRINPLAYGFAAMALVGAGLFVFEGVARDRLRFTWNGGVRAWVGVGLVVFALWGYPLWSWWLGHRFPLMPTFGLPCPTTLFTIGMLGFATPPIPRKVLAVPVLWALIGSLAAFLLGVLQDLSLLIAALAGGAFAFDGRPTRRST